MMDLAAELADHCERFNRGVITGNYDDMLKHLDEEVELIFVGVPAGPFVGRDAVTHAYRVSPPDDQIVLLATRVLSDTTVEGDYAWLSNTSIKAGELRLTVHDRLVTRVVVTFA